MTKPADSLASAFPPVSRETWRKVVEKALNAPPEKALATVTDDGIALQGLYTREDWPAGRSGLPGQAPFTRGASAVRGQAWDLRTVIDDPRPAEAKAALAADLDGGATSIALRLDERVSLDGRAAKAPWGLRLHNLADLSALLDGVILEALPVAMEGGAHALCAGLGVLHLARKQGGAFEGALNFDPLAMLATSGAARDGGLAVLGELASFVEQNFPRASAVGIDTRPYHNAGASEAQEIAVALATGAAYLRALDQSGFAPARAARQFRFNMATDGRFFRSLAKLRALRLCWARVAEACGVPEEICGAVIWAETSFRDLAKRDPYVNMLRGAAGCVAAALGGAEAISVRPFDEALAVPGLFGRRIARNTSLVLAEEAGLARVQDPAGGSWSLESVTEALAAKAWAIFQDIERAGGMEKALHAGVVQSMIAGVESQRAQRIAVLDLPLTGTSIFPDLAEPMVSRAEIDWKALARTEKKTSPLSSADLAKLKPGASNRIAAAIELIAGGASFRAISDALLGAEGARGTVLVARRYAEPFEKLRDASDALPERPRLFIAHLGTPRDSIDRANFARNLFAVGGIDAVDGHGDVSALASAAKASGAKLFAIATSDARLKEDGAALVRELRGLKPAKLYVVGKPNGAGDALQAAGADDFLSERSDAVKLLEGAFASLGGSR